MRGADEPDEDRAFDCLRASLQSQDWVVYGKPPFADAGQVLAYLSRYTHKTAIGNHRLVDFDGKHVRFRWRDYADGNRRKVMRLEVEEFIRRFLLHVLPRGFTRLRHYGLLANRNRSRKLARCRRLLGQPEAEPLQEESAQELMLRVTGIDVGVCRYCGRGHLRHVAILKPGADAVVPMQTARPP